MGLKNMYMGAMNSNLLLILRLDNI